MLQFINSNNRRPEFILRIGSNGKARVLISGARHDHPVTVKIVQGKGKAVKGDQRYAPLLLWHLSELDEHSVIEAQSDYDDPVELNVAMCNGTTSYDKITARLSARLIGINLDDHIDEVLELSPVLGEGIYFRPVSKKAFEDALINSKMFHHDDRTNFWGSTAASATVGEGYREISTPSLHCAVSEFLCSVHIDDYAFMIHGPDGTAIISPEVIMHIPDELLFRKPMNYLRLHNHTFAAAVLERLHPVLPSETNGYRGAAGLGLHFGDGPAADWKTGVPRLVLEGTYRPLGNMADQFYYSAKLRLANGGDAEQKPSWVLTLNADLACRDIACKEHKETVGINLTVDLDAKTRPTRHRRR